MKAELVNKVEVELRNVYRHFGTDARDAEALIAKKLESLKYKRPEQFNIGNENVVGFTVDLAVKCDRITKVVRNGIACDKNETVALVLFVTENSVEFILNKYDCYELDSGTEYDNERYERVLLGDIHDVEYKGNDNDYAFV